MACKKPKYRKSAGCVVACGQCTPCLLKKQREKASRVLLESRANGITDTLFVTLTYDDEHLPYTFSRMEMQRLTPKQKAQGFEPRKELKTYSCPTGTLYPPDLINFLKKLRYYGSTKGFQIRAVYAGEYGDEKRRPHYHLIIWGIPYKERMMIFRSWTDKQKKLMCHHSRLDIQIPKNERHIANYLSKYLLSDKKRKDAASLNGAFPEFYRTSKGLGLQYADGVSKALTKESGLANLWIDGKMPSSFFFDGKNYPIDRYMKAKIYAKLPPIFAEELPKIALEDYKAQMYNVYEDALMDQAFAEKALTIPLEQGIELAVQRLNARRAAEIEIKHSFFQSKRRSSDV